MTKSELLEKRNSKDKEFVSLLELAKVEKRQLTEDENLKVDSLKADIRNLDSDLEKLEKVDSETRAKAEKEATEKRALEIKTEEEEIIKLRAEAVTLDEGNAKKRNMKGRNELIEQFREQMGTDTGGTIIMRADTDGDTTEMAKGIPLGVLDLSIIGSNPLWKQMGVDLMPGAKGTFTLPFKDPTVGEKLAELASVTGDVITPDGVLVTPNRYSTNKTFTLETLNSATPAFINKIIADLVVGCDRAITKEVYTKILAIATAVATGAVTKVGFDALMGGAEVELEGSFLANRATFFEAKGVAIDAGSGRFLAERAGTGQTAGVVYDGTPFWYSNLFIDGTDQQYVLYGDLSEILVADYDTVEIIVDKYTAAKTGKVIITVNKIVNVSAKNPVAFSKSPDLDVA